MYMENKIILLLVLFLLSCNKNSKSDIEYNQYLEKTIRLLNFENYRINKISFESLEKTKENINYNFLKFDTINKIDLYLPIDSPSINLINKGCIIIINDKLKYKITDVKSAQIERISRIFWKKKIIEYKLKEYKLNDSLIDNLNTITIFK